MKRFYLPLVPILILLAFISLGHIVRSTGSPGGKTGSPGDNQTTCTQCHGGGKATDVTGWISTDIPVEGYRPGVQYTISVRGERAAASLFGFELTAEKASKAKTGGFSTGNSNQLQLLSNGTAVTHTNQGITGSGGTKNWSVKWTAPAKGTGDVTFYAAVNTANGDGGTGGDVIFATNLRVKEQDLSGIDDPVTIPEIRVFPNPADRTVKFETHGITSDYFDIQIFSINGQAVFTQTYRNEATMNTIEVPVQHLANGLEER
jgi:hypothetical protein